MKLKIREAKVSFKKYGEVTTIKTYKFKEKRKYIICDKCKERIGVFDKKFAKINERLIPIENLSGMKIKCFKCNNLIDMKEDVR